ncbi:MAG: hypothetical protein OK442_06300 [Thaumarchaeota archaeon]|nr:hypothetical protein [Nitrososphaerota archaeon]
MKQTRSLGIASPEGKDIFELYISVESRPAVLAKIATVMGEKNVDILAGHMQCSDDRHLGYDLFYVEMADSKVTPKALVETLKKLDFVVDAEIEPKSDVKFETMMFPLTRSGHTRVFVLSANGWAALINSILSTFGTAGGVILHNQGVSVGAEIVDSIKALFQAPVGSDLEMENLKAYFSAVGLGILQISGDRKAMKVRIEQPVTSGQKESVVDQFLVGVVRGAIIKIYSDEYVVQKLGYQDERIVFDLVPEKPLRTAADARKSDLRLPPNA